MKCYSNSRWRSRTPTSVVATRSAARVHRLAGKTAIHEALEPLVKGIRGGADVRTEARTVGQILLNRIPEIAARKRVVVSADADLHQLPFEVLVTESGKPLLDSHVVSYVPSASVLVFLRNRQTQNAPLRAALAVSASQTTSIASPSSTGAASPFGAISRGVYDLEATQLPALPSANDEARSVSAASWNNVHRSARRFGNRAGTQEAAASRLQGASLCSARNREHQIPGAFGAGSQARRGRGRPLSSAGDPVVAPRGGSGNTVRV